MAASDQLTGRHVLVVGAGTRHSDDPEAPLGNGRAIALEAARAGAVVACADIDPQAAADTVALIEEIGGRAIALVADITDPTVCAELVEDTVAQLGALDGLVLNVGIGLGGGMEGTSVEQWDIVFSVNVRSHFLVTQAALPHLGAGSSIVYVSSLAGYKPGSRLPAYDASKAAIGGLCRSVAREVSRHGVRANVIAPGLIDTPLGRLATESRPGRAKSPVPLGRQGTAQEVALPVIFLLSDDASYITGQILHVDGGLLSL
ncbi:MAG: SDR family NAD(P)-dependent oxidoreductase [Acidimicrobiales bacterium]